MCFFFVIMLDVLVMSMLLLFVDKTDITESNHLEESHYFYLDFGKLKVVVNFSLNLLYTYHSVVCNCRFPKCPCDFPFYNKIYRNAISNACFQ